MEEGKRTLYAPYAKMANTQSFATPRTYGKTPFLQKKKLRQYCQPSGPTAQEIVANPSAYIPYPAC